MKKKYVKPQIMFEDFTMTTNIAGDCEFRTNLQTKGECGYPTRFGVIFMSTIAGCEYHEPDTNDSLCYHVPVDIANIFNS